MIVTDTRNCQKVSGPWITPKLHVIKNYSKGGWNPPPLGWIGLTARQNLSQVCVFKLLQEASISHLSVSSDTFVCWMSKKQFQLRWSVCRKTSQEEASISHFEFIISWQGCLSSTQNLSQNSGACQWLAKAILTELWLWGELIVRLS